MNGTRNRRARIAVALATLVAAGVFAALAIAETATGEAKAPKAEAAETPAAPEAAAPAAPAASTKESGAATAAKEAVAVKETTKDGEYAAGTRPVKPEKTPDRVQVQHILIGFKGSVPNKDIKLTKDEAKKLAYEVLERAWKGEDFGAMVRKYTNDSPPGIYAMAGTGITSNPGEFSRDGMVPAFGDVGFNISPGNIGIADWDPKKSPFGWHIIKRLK